MSASKDEARISVRLQRELKAIIEEAATALGQTVSDFTTSCLVREARLVLREAETTELSQRDRDAFLAAIDGRKLKPNKALKAAAAKYKKTMN